MALVAVITTTADKDEARVIARALVEKGLAACVQISEIESFYTWQGELQQDPEYRLVAKTTEEHYSEVEKTIRALHSYELPAIYALPLSRTFEPYAAWVESSCQPTPK
ncbi:MAG TPA: divalent-cation tolerance protein CutA [Firmicutes bacterium]|jgi:periplasmic divalent cation tolerance protein|nr:divalent-cation tolerance protein CutA [Bacillota bacterium]